MGLVSAGSVLAQPCDPLTPTYTVNLSSKADSVWTSPNIARLNYCCAASGADNCIEFNLTLSPNSNGIQLDIISGAVPGGALFYQIGCGASYQVGQPICLSGVGPHRITFCKPGNNTNVYRITSIPKPNLSGSLLVTQACSGRLIAKGLVESSITWTSTPNNATYNSYLNCTSGCDTVTVVPTGAYPSTVMYKVCGSVLGSCGSVTFCDSVTMRFLNNSSVAITPKPAAVCFGGSNTTIKANPSGGYPPYRYLWSNNDTNQSISVGVGTYIVQMTDSTHCNTVRDTVVVTANPSLITANAGPDSTICSRRKFAQLHGTVQLATGGKWLGGTGTFSPNDSTLYTQYTPSAAETSAGSVTLRLQTTGNGNCPAGVDTVVFQIKPSPTPVITSGSSDTICKFASKTYRVTACSSCTYNWTISGGSIVGTATDTLVNVNWGGAGTGTVTAKVTMANGCDSTVTKSILKLNKPFPVITGPDTLCARKYATYTVPKVTGDTYFWIATGGSISGSMTDTTVIVEWDTTSAGVAQISVIQTNSSGCDTTISKLIHINPIPFPAITGTSPACENKRYIYSAKPYSNSFYSWTVIGGDIETSSTDSAIRVLWTSSGLAAIILDMNTIYGCDTSTSTTVTVNSTPVPVITGTTTVCERKTYTYRVTPVTGHSYLWTVTGGTLIGSATDTSIKVYWPSNGTGTVKVKQTNSFGCDSTVTKNITINPTPVPVITGNTTVCEYKTYNYKVNSATGNSYLWTVTGGTVLGITTDSTINVKWGATGTGTVTVKRTNAQGCDSTVSKTITIRPTPVPVITGPSPVCALREYTYKVSSGSSNTYYWSVVGGTITSSIVDSVVRVTWKDTTAGVLTVVRTNNFGCDSTVTKAITIKRFTMPQITGPDSACEGRSGTYRVKVNAGSTYLWTINGGTLQGGANTDTLIHVLWGPAGTRSVKVTETNSSGCDTNITKQVKVNITPAPTIAGTPTVCERKISTYTFTAQPGNSYKWTVTGGTIQGNDTSSILNVFWGPAGTGLITLRQVNLSGCDSTVSQSITIKPSPKPTLIGNTTVCEQRTENYVATGSLGSTYQWTVTGGTFVGVSTGTAVTVRWTAAGTGKINVKETNSSGCDSTISKNIAINATPVPVISGPKAVCDNKVSIYTAQAKVGNTYQWSVAGGTIMDTSLHTIAFIKWGTPGGGSVTLKQTNASGCDSTTVIYPVINPTPRPFVFGNNQPCERKKEVYSVTLVPGNTYKWTAVGGTVVGVPTNDKVTISWGPAGPGKVVVTQTNDKSCDSTVEFPVTIQLTPNPVITGPANVCEFKDATYQVPLVTGDTYTWTITGGNIIAGANTNIVNVHWAAAGIGQVKVRQKNALGCDTTATFDVNKLTKPKPKINGSKRSCAFSSGNIYTVNVSGSPNHTYNWSVTGGSQILNGQGGNSVNVKFDVPGIDSITVTEIDNITGCDSTVTLVIVIDTVLKPKFTNDTTFGCRPFNVQFSGNQTNGTNTYQWFFGDGRTIIAPNPQHLFRRSQNYKVMVISTNVSGCKDTAYHTVVVYNNPIPDFTHDYIHDTVYAHEDSVTFSNTSIAADSFVWWFGNGKSYVSFEPPDRIWYDKPGNYPVKLLVKDTITGCSDSITKYIEVRVHESLFVPTAFSPNDDGYNDVFSISFENMLHFQFQIYTRWGQKIFETHDPRFVWDGKGPNGKPYPQDAYVYLIEAQGMQGTRFYRQGTITILP